MLVRIPALFIAAVFASVPVAAQPPAGTPKPLALSVTYEDGRSTIQPLKDHLGFWTAQFPRTADIDPRIRALDVGALREKDEAVVSVSLLYGGYSPDDSVPVALVRVSEQAPVQVTELTPFGVRPITLSLIVTGPLAVLQVPRIVVPSGDLEVHVDQPGWEPIYRFRIINHGHVAVRSFELHTSNKGQPAISGRRRHPRDEPLIAPGATYTFEVRTTARSSEDAVHGLWHDWDEVRITSVLWDDGIVEGDAGLKQAETAQYKDRLTKVESVLQWFADAARLPFGEAERILDEKARTEGTNAARSAVQQELTTFATLHPDRADEAFHRWTAAAGRSYQRWAARLRSLAQDSRMVRRNAQ